MDERPELSRGLFLLLLALCLPFGVVGLVMIAATLFALVAGPTGSGRAAAELVTTTAIVITPLGPFLLAPAAGVAMTLAVRTGAAGALKALGFTLLGLATIIYAVLYLYVIPR